MKEKYTRIGVLILIISFQAAFLGIILKEAYSRPASPFVLPLLLIVTAGLVATYLKVQLHDAHYQHEDFWVAVWVPVGAVATHFLSLHLKLGPVIAAGIVGTVGSYLPSFQKNPVYLKKVPYAFYCGAFIGMCSGEVAPGFGFIVSAGMVAALLFLLSKSLFLGVGGKLGVLAFGGVVTTALLFYLFNLPA